MKCKCGQEMLLIAVGLDIDTYEETMVYYCDCGRVYVLATDDDLEKTLEVWHVPG